MRKCWKCSVKIEAQVLLRYILRNGDKSFSVSLSDSLVRWFYLRLYDLNTSAFPSLFSQIKALIKSLKIPNLAKWQYFSPAVPLLLLPKPCSCKHWYCWYARFSHWCASHSFVPLSVPLDCSFCFVAGDPVICMYRVYWQSAMWLLLLIKSAPNFLSLPPSSPLKVTSTFRLNVCH